jgi:choline dehydrogenase-like flavoprotein
LHDHAITFFHLSRPDRELLMTGLSRICALLLAGGAEVVYPGGRNMVAVSSRAEAEKLAVEYRRCRLLDLSVLHVFGSCPMGERKEFCRVNSYGKLHAFENLYLSDASILPDSTGVNPQGTIMAIALRNARSFLKQKGI